MKKPNEREALALRRLLEEENRTHTELAGITGIPKERIDTLTRGNAPMRLQEAILIARQFYRDVRIFTAQSPKEQISFYCETHKDELAAFEELIAATTNLNRSLRRHIPESVRKAVPKFSSYLQGGSSDPIVKMKIRETSQVDTIFKQIEFLSEKESILLSGQSSNEKYFIVPVTTYMHRWWDKSVKPKMITSIRFNDEKQLRALESPLQHIYGNYENKKANPAHASSYDAEIASIIEKEKAAGRNITGTYNLASAKKTYENLITRLRTLDYFHFIAQIQRLGKKSETILGDSLKHRVQTLQEYGAISKDLTMISAEIQGLTPITAGFNVTINHPSDTELARLVIEQNKFKWFFNGEGEIVASNGFTVIEPSLTLVAKEMRLAGFFGENAVPNHSHAVIWQKIPSSEKELIQILRSKRQAAEIEFCTEE